MDFVWRLRIRAVEEILKRTLITYISQVDKLLKSFLEPITEETVVNSSYTRDIDANDAVLLHLFGIESGTDQVDA